jgi:hypothetical protein
MSESQILYDNPMVATPASILTIGELITILQKVPSDAKIAQENDPDMCGYYYVTDIILSKGRVCFGHCGSYAAAADVKEMNVTGKWTTSKTYIEDSEAEDVNEKPKTLVYNDNTNPAVVLTVKSFLDILSTVPVTAKVALWNEPHIYNTCYVSSMTINIKNDLLMLCNYSEGDAADVDETDRTGRWVEEDGESDDD